MNRAEIVAAEAFHVSEFIREEMEARGWDEFDVAVRMGGGDIRKNLLILQLTLHVRDPNLILCDRTSAQLGVAFDVDATYHENLDRAWREHPTTIAAHQGAPKPQATHPTAHSKSSEGTP